MSDLHGKQANDGGGGGARSGMPPQQGKRARKQTVLRPIPPRPACPSSRAGSPVQPAGGVKVVLGLHLKGHEACHDHSCSLLIKALDEVAQVLAVHPPGQRGGRLALSQVWMECKARRALAPHGRGAPTPLLAHRRVTVVTRTRAVPLSCR